MKLSRAVHTWGVEDVVAWLDRTGFQGQGGAFLAQNINGKAILLLTESDLRDIIPSAPLGTIKQIYWEILLLQQENNTFLCFGSASGNKEASSLHHLLLPHQYSTAARTRTYSSDSEQDSNEPSWEGDISHSNGVATRLQPEYLKTFISCGYMFLVTWITAYVMVFVHDRVPDRERHPPLPDIFLDNVPHISWAFQLCEITICILSFVGFIILFFHKHRSILLRRFAALAGSVFLLRCATMFITSLSVPGHHSQCAPRSSNDSWLRLQQAWIIWQGGGLSLKGIRTCGDYMFSGHTTALTLLNFFITEYTPRRMYNLHIASWVLNAFGIFFILAAHEHYSIDVFIAFYITSRMFLYYHSLANNRALHQRDSFRTKIWFPMFGYFEANIDGIVPNEYSNPLSLANLRKFYSKITSLVSIYKAKVRLE